MKIGVISDTHGLVRPEVYEAFEGVDLILHAGDIGSKDVIIELEAIAPVKAITGNADADLCGEFKEKLNFKIGRRVFHLQHILNGIPEETGPNGEDISEVIVFGHTHSPFSRQVGKTLYFNPGSSGPKRLNLPITVGILTMDEKTALAEVIDLQSRVAVNLKQIN